MRLVIFLVLGFAVFDVARSRGLGQLFSEWYDEVFEDSQESSEASFCDILAQLFGLDFDDDDDDDDDDDSQGSSGPVHHQLPGGPSWIETMYPSRPQVPGNEGVDQGQRPTLTNPFNPQQEQQPQGQVPPDLSTGAKPIPNRPPVEESPSSETPVLKPGENPTPNSNATKPPASTLVISIAGDEVDDTDGEGVLEREQETG